MFFLRPFRLVNENGVAQAAWGAPDPAPLSARAADTGWALVEGPGTGKLQGTYTPKESDIF